MWPEGGVCGGGPPKCYFTRKEMASNLPSKMAQALPKELWLWQHHTSFSLHPHSFIYSHTASPTSLF